MKHCPKCSRTYTDETLNFCLDDGEWLQVASSMEDFPTQVLSAQDGAAPSQENAKTIVSSKSFEQRSSPRINSIAVLPFAQWSSDPDNEYFCDGLAEDLLNSLAKIEGLKVAACTSAFSFKGKNVSVGDIGRALGVETIVEGSVRKAGDRLRVTVQLVNADKGYQIWSERYDREMGDVFEMQDEITEAVIRELRPKLLGGQSVEVPKRHAANTEAYHLYLRGRFLLNKFTADNAALAIEYFNQAITADPGFALAYAGLADACVMLTEMGPMPPQEAMPQAKAAALKALELDDSLAEAHSSLGVILQDYEYDFAAAERAFLRAIELSPNNPIPRQSYAILLTELLRYDEAEVQFQKALEVDPLSVVANWAYGFCLFLARRYDDALERSHNTLELDPHFGVAYLTIAFAHQMKGEYDASVEAYARCSEVMGFPQNAEFVRSSYRGGWESFLRAMASADRSMIFSSYIAAVFYASMGDAEGAFAELENSFAARESHIIMMKVDPRFDILRSDPRYKELLKKIGFPE